MLCQVAGLPSRFVTLTNKDAAYCGHVIIEVYRREIWGAVDPTTNVVYRDSSVRPVTTWELMNYPLLVKGNWSGESTGYTNVEQFQAAAIANYFVWNWNEYD